VCCKWDSYCINIGPEDTTPDLETVRAFKKDVQEQMDRESRSKPRPYGANTSKPIQRTPRVMKNSADTMSLCVSPLRARITRGGELKTNSLVVVLMH
jgi:DNA polymerase alpha subunit B